MKASFEISEDSVWDFGPSPKLGAAWGRTCRPEETEERVTPVLPLVPVTRVAELTPLDRIGLPVFSAVTPMARDLTSHLGKGMDEVSARVSAVMEAVERVSAERVREHTLRRASFVDLQQESGPEPIDPTSLDLPADSRYLPDRTLSWVESFELVSGTRVWLPADLALSPPSEGILHDVDTNGLASGNTHIEAVVHGLCEVIERDVQSQYEFRILYGGPGTCQIAPSPQIDRDSLPPACAELVAHLRRLRFEVVVQEARCELDVPTFRVLILDPAYPTPSGPEPLLFAGWGTALRKEVALARALSEAVQSRMSFVQGARDGYNTTPSDRRLWTRIARLEEILSPRRRCFSQVPSHETSDLREDLHLLLQKLDERGFDRVVVTDLTRPELDLPVVRVRVPGLACFAVNRRRVGWRCLRHLI